MNFPIPAPFFVGCISVALITVFAVLGFRFGTIIKQRRDEGASAPIGGVIAAVLGLLAFTMAFIFSIAATHFDTRKKLVLEESNALGTLYLRSSLLAEPTANKMHSLIKEYVEKRINNISQIDVLTKTISESEALQDQMWGVAIELAKSDPGSRIIPLFIETLNQVIDLHSVRVAYRLYYRIPLSIWTILAFLTAISMLGVGYQFGLAGRADKVIVIILTLSFSSIVFLIADLDNQAAGMLRVSQKPMQELYSRITSGAQATSAK